MSQQDTATTSSHQEEKYTQQQLESQPASTVNDITQEPALYLPTVENADDHSSESQSAHHTASLVNEGNQHKPTKLNRRKSNTFGNIFNDFVVRSFGMNSILFFYCIFSFPLWFGSVPGDNVTTAYLLSACAMIAVFNASICGLMLAIFDKYDKAIPAKKIIIYFIITLYFIGAFFYFIAACYFARILNQYGTQIHKDLSSLSGIIWTEMFYIAAFTVITGLDLWKRFLNDKTYRMYTMCSLYTFCGMVLSFSYIISGNIGISEYSSSIYAGICYLFGFVFCGIYLVYRIVSMFVIQKYKMEVQSKLELIKPMIDVTVAILLLVLMFMNVMIYWSTKRETIEEYMYYFGFGLFILSQSILMSFDIKLWYIIQCFVYGRYDKFENAIYQIQQQVSKS